MKIAYVAEWDFSTTSGVSKKIESQIQTWNRLGANVSMHIVTPNSLPLTESNVKSENRFFFSSRIPLYLRGGARTYLNKILSARHLRQSLKQKNPDLIFYRIGIWYPLLASILQRWPTVVEINSLELNELNQVGKIKKWIYPWGRNKILGAARAFSPVSNEIARDIESLKKPTFVCGNGYDFSSEPLVERQVISDRPQGLFVGTDGQFWQGIDLILKWAEKLPQIDFHLVGISKTSAPSNVKFHGPLFHQELRELSVKMDFGIGTLALHRKKMQEASPLKTREYGAWGLPFIYAYQDTDLPESLDFALRLPNHEVEVLQSIPQVLEFAQRWKHQPHDPSRFRKYFDREQKEVQRLAFFKTLLEPRAERT
jgi:hypothetical protein